MSDREVERLLSNLQIKSFTTQDEQEVAGYAEVMELVFSFGQDIAPTESHIKQLHRDLLSYIEKDAWHRGNSGWTSTQCSVAAPMPPVALLVSVDGRTSIRVQVQQSPSHRP